MRAVKFGKKCGENAGKNSVTRLDVAAHFQFRTTHVDMLFRSCKYRLFFTLFPYPPWHVVVLSKDKTNFNDGCLYCQHKFVAGVTRLRNHFVD